MAPIGMSIPEPICMPGVMTCMIGSLSGKLQLSYGSTFWHWKLTAIEEPSVNCHSNKVRPL